MKTLTCRLLVLLCCGVAMSEEGKLKLDFLRRDSLVVTAGHWLIAVDIPLGNITESLSDVLSRLKIIRNQSTSFIHDNTGDYEEESNILATEILGTLEDEASELYTRVERLLKPVPYQKKTRGYFDIFGKGLHVIAGVATDEDLQQTNQRLDTVATQNKQIVHVLENQMTYFRATSTAVEKNTNALSRLDKGMLALQSIVKTSDERINERIDFLSNEIHFINSIQSAYTLTRRSLNLISRAIDRCEKAELEAWESRLTTNLISPLEFLSLLRSVQSALPQELSLVTYPSDENLPFLYRSSAVNLVRRGSTLRFLLNIPLRQSGHMYHVFDVSPYASNKNGSTLYKANIDTTKLAVSIDSNSYMLLPPNYISNCHHAGLIYMCPSDLPVLTSQYPSCAISTFQSPGHTITKHCLPVNEMNSVPLFYQGEISGVWHYFTHETIKFTFECPSADSKVEKKWGTVYGQGKIIVPPGCVARSPMFVLHSNWRNKLINVSTADSFMIQSYSPALFLIPTKTVTTTTQANYSVLDNTTQNTTTTESPYMKESKSLLTDMEAGISNINNSTSRQNMMDYFTPAVTFGLGGGSVLLLVLIVLVIVLVLCRRQPTPAASNMYVQQPTAPVAYPSVQYVAAPMAPVTQSHIMARCPRDY